VRNGADIEGCRVLIVEDNFLLGLEIEALLRESGCVVLGPVGTVDEALALLEREDRPDLAVLDVDLHGRRVTPVAAALHSRAVPSVLVTGYAAAQLREPELRGLPRLEKPVSGSDLLRALGHARGAAERSPAYQNKPST
jgi:CheY-like chemotaxis protein